MRPDRSGGMSQLPKDQIFPDIKPGQSIDNAPGQPYRAGDSRAPTDPEQQTRKNINEEKGEGESLAFTTSQKDRQATAKLNVEGPNRQTEAPSAFMRASDENAKPPGVTNRDTVVNTDISDVNQRDSTAYMADQTEQDRNVQDHMARQSESKEPDEKQYVYTAQDAESKPGYDAPIDKDMNESAYGGQSVQQSAADNDTSAYDRMGESERSPLERSAKQYASDMKEELKDKAEDIAHKAGEYWDDYKDNVDKVKTSAQEKVHDIKENLSEKKDEFMEKASEVKEAASEKTSDTMEKIKEMPHIIKEKIKDYTGIGKQH